MSGEGNTHMLFIILIAMTNLPQNLYVNQNFKTYYPCALFSYDIYICNISLSDAISRNDCELFS